MRSNKRRGVLGRWAVIIVMALVLAFLVSVAPVGGAAKPKYCSDTCGRNIKSDPTDEWDEHKETKICVTRLGTKWLVQDRSCEEGYYYKVCSHRSWCGQTKACAAVGDEFEKVTGHWKSCTKWVKHYEYS